jgi:hypothetical protein
VEEQVVDSGVLENGCRAFVVSKDSSGKSIGMYPVRIVSATETEVVVEKQKMNIYNAGSGVWCAKWETITEIVKPEDVIKVVKEK